MSLGAGDTVCDRALSLAEQRAWASDVREVLRAAPLVRPMTSFGMPMRVRVSAAGKLGWVGDGEYRYDPTQRGGRPWPMMPQAWLELANEIGGDLPWDSAIINWYDENASLGWHQDLNETDLSKPIVTISLGDACSWAIREDKESPISRVRLESGAITLLAGPTRGYFHTVERIIPAPLFSPLQEPGRISVTIRVAG